MADFRILTSSERPAVGGVPAGKAAPSSVMSRSVNWDGAGGTDQIRAVRIDDTHIAEVRGATECYEFDYSMPTEEEEAAAEAEEEDDSVYVIEYSNPEEEGESYQFTMSVDKTLPPKKPVLKHPFARQNSRAPLPVIPRPGRPRQEVKRRRKRKEVVVRKEAFVSNKCVLELGENYSDVMAMNSTEGQLMCTLCPPPGKFFKRSSGLAIHLKHMHHLETNKSFFCTTCKKSLRTQIQLDAHTKRHANSGAVFTCLLCAADTENKAEGTGYSGPRPGLKKHLEQEHPGVIPRCHVCNKGFKTLVSYLDDQFRHVGVSPYYCARCQIYEMTARGLSVHTKNHDKKRKNQPLMPPPQPPPSLPPPPPQEVSTGNNPQTSVVLAANPENSATDASDV